MLTNLEEQYWRTQKHLEYKRERERVVLMHYFLFLLIFQGINYHKMWGLSRTMIYKPGLIYMKSHAVKFTYPWTLYKFISNVYSEYEIQRLTIYFLIPQLCFSIQSRSKSIFLILSKREAYFLCHLTESKSKITILSQSCSIVHILFEYHRAKLFRNS